MTARIDCAAPRILSVVPISIAVLVQTPLLTVMLPNFADRMMANKSMGILDLPSAHGLASWTVSATLLQESERLKKKRGCRLNSRLKKRSRRVVALQKLNRPD